MRDLLSIEGHKNKFCFSLRVQQCLVFVTFGGASQEIYTHSDTAYHCALRSFASSECLTDCGLCSNWLPDRHTQIQQLRVV